MVDLSTEFCIKVREARRAAGLTQSDVAREMGCRQSALSMFEQGDGTKLNEAVIKKLAQKFGLEIIKGEPSTANLPPSTFHLPPASGFCPNPHCPSNHRYQVEERVLYRPDRAVADPVGGRFCALCGELLERTCPNCGVPVHEGAICSICGDPYVTTYENRR